MGEGGGSLIAEEGVYTKGKRGRLELSLLSLGRGPHKSNTASLPPCFDRFDWP